MPRISLTTTVTLPVGASAAYAVLADYRKGHPHILPRPPFLDLVVEQGGVGAGTVIRVRMRAMGGVRTLRLAVSEPEPGRVLVEQDDEAGAYTTFTVEPRGPAASEVTIATRWEAPGLLGHVERWLAPTVAARVFQAELKKLGEVASAWAEAGNVAAPESALTPR